MCSGSIRLRQQPCSSPPDGWTQTSSSWSPPGSKTTPARRISSSATSHRTCSALMSARSRLGLSTGSFSRASANRCRARRFARCTTSRVGTPSTRSRSPASSWSVARPCARPSRFPSRAPSKSSCGFDSIVCRRRSGSCSRPPRSLPSRRRPRWLAKPQPPSRSLRGTRSTAQSPPA